MNWWGTNGGTAITPWGVGELGSPDVKNLFVENMSGVFLKE